MSVKKKIKDLTFREFIEIAKKYCGNCTRCPLYSIEFGTESCGCDFASYIEKRDALNKQYEKYQLEQEIEVDVDE